MIRFDHVTLQYSAAPMPTLIDVDLTIPEGELVMVTGKTGTGKSTLLGLINGLVPHFTGGTLQGEVLINGHSIADHPPRDLAHIVGVVSQNPLAGFVTDSVEEELAYSMEQLAIPPEVMRKRVEETLDLLGIADLRDRPLMALSGGQQQRVAIGAALTAHPQVLVLDEPTSALDPTAAEEVLSAITRLVHDLGLTVVIAEHRLERIVQYIDHMVHLPGNGSVLSGNPSDVLADSDLAPPIVHLGRALGWQQIPLSVRDARRAAASFRQRLSSANGERHHQERVGTPSDSAQRRPVLTARRVVVQHGSIAAVNDVSLDLHAGQITALMGRNGAGKSSLLWALQGSGRRRSGTVHIQAAHVHEQSRSASQRYETHAGRSGSPGITNQPLTLVDHSQVAPVDPASLPANEARQLVGLVPQTPTDLLYLNTVADECNQADRDANVDAGTCRALLEHLAPGIADDIHPRDLSEGQKLSLVLAIQLTAEPPIIFLDEPTRGLDYHAKHALTEVVHELADRGRSIVIATHDVEFVATTADRVLVMAEGEVIADGDTRTVVTASPAFAPQVAKVMSPISALTVAEVEQLVNRLDQ